MSTIFITIYTHENLNCLPSWHSSYFEDLAVGIIDYLYKEKEETVEAAYLSLVSEVDFWGRDITPLSIADDGGAMRFMGRSCCQTFLRRVWWRHMDLSTASWKVNLGT